MSCINSLSYNCSAGGFKNRSLTCVATSRLRELTMYSNLVSWAVSPHTVNCASTCINQTSGSASWPEQSNFMLMAATRAGTRASSVNIEFSSVQYLVQITSAKRKVWSQLYLWGTVWLKIWAPVYTLRRARNVVQQRTSAKAHSNTIMYIALYATHWKFSWN